MRQIGFRGAEFPEWLRLRQAVLREPLGLCYSEEDIAKEADQDHLCYFCGGRILGGLIVHRLPHSNTPPLQHSMFKMRQVAVLPECQGQGIGTEMVLFSEKHVLERGGTHFMLHSREEALPFYEKLGYHAQGPPFEEVGLVHYLMTKAL